MRGQGDQVRVPHALTMMLSAAVLGAMIGYWLPTSTHRVAERLPHRDTTSIPADSAAPAPPLPTPTPATPGPAAP